MEKIVLCEPLRTAVGGFGGTLKDTSTAELGSTVVKEIITRTGIDPKEIEAMKQGLMTSECNPAVHRIRHVMRKLNFNSNNGGQLIVALVARSDLSSLRR